MHPDAKAYLDQIQDDRFREKLAVFFHAFDSMDRENSHLRIMLQGSGPCPYGHFKTGGCELGYPGCACMDNLLALQSWTPEDENKAIVRIGRLLNQTRRLLTECQEGLCAAAMMLEARKAPDIAIQEIRRLGAARVTDVIHGV